MFLRSGSLPDVPGIFCALKRYEINPALITPFLENFNFSKIFKIGTPGRFHTINVAVLVYRKLAFRSWIFLENCENCNFYFCLSKISIFRKFQNGHPRTIPYDKRCSFSLQKIGFSALFFWGKNGKIAILTFFNRKSQFFEIFKTDTRRFHTINVVVLVYRKLAFRSWFFGENLEKW